MICSSTASSSRAGEDGLQQRPCIPAAERLHAELREAGQSAPAVTRRECERDPFRQQAARHERERSGRCVVEPLRVVDQAQQGLLLGGIGEEAENRQPDEKRARRCPALSPKATRARHAADQADGRRTMIGEQSCCNAA